MNDSPVSIILTALIAGFILKLWIDDYRAFGRGESNPKALPGATAAPMWLLGLSALGSLLLVGVETVGEYALGVSDEQSSIGAFFLVAMIAAGIVEEVLFRGFAVIRSKGRTVLVLSIIAFSVLFALVHAHLLGASLDVEEAGEAGGRAAVFTLELGPAQLWWTCVLFLNSLWWYTVRFLPANVHRSLLPCFAGHIASNVGVFVVKLAQGHVTW